MMLVAAAALRYRHRGGLRILTPSLAGAADRSPDVRPAIELDAHVAPTFSPGDDPPPTQHAFNIV
jgi:hypothetical protein